MNRSANHPDRRKAVWTLRGAHPQYGGVSIGIMSGTAAECEREWKRRESLGWTGLEINLNK